MSSSDLFIAPDSLGIHTGNRFLFAVPKKGRLLDETLRLLDGADLKFHRKPRLDIALCLNMPVAIVFLPASDIAKFVGEGNVDLGVTGLDVIRESGMESHVNVVEPLGFGKCKLQIQVPETSEYTEPKQLLGKRIVTSFVNICENYFADIGSDGDLKAVVSYISGSVEAACSLGLADGIVDLVESGETMKAAHLRPIGTITETEAVLISSKKTTKPDIVRIIGNRIRGFLVASKHMLVKYNIEKTKLPQATKITPGNRAPTISPLVDQDWVAVESMIKKHEQATIIDELEACGARDILVLSIHNSRV